ncbi:unnamed protein product [Phytophthora fragariaefolia]|uniref:Unnamed protein product n=1 Tax=Phytophthora fragariaefolia TaxID=1490495 RepID=A0A9W6XQV3_9STRA|nr:unnamed protein product [Phytophthora fragariaefolia]
MRQRASTKTQRRLRQQQLRDPYALTDDVYCEPPTFRVGGLVTAVGVLQLVAAMALGGFVFGGALLFCAVLLAALGLALLHHSDPKAGAQGLGLKQSIGRLLALRRSALDYSLTLSIAQSQQYLQPQRKELQIAVVPFTPTPQKVVATMALKPEKIIETKVNRLADNAPLATLNRVNMEPLATINSASVEETESLFMEKRRANSEPKQVLRSRPLLPLKPKVQKAVPVNMTQEKKKKKTQQVKATPVMPNTLVKNEMKAQKPQKSRKTSEPKVAMKKEVQPPAVLPKVEPKTVLPALLPKAKSARPVLVEPKAKPVEVASPATIVVEPCVPEASVPTVTPLPVFPEQKPLVEVARSEPAIERELVVTRKVLLYLSPEGEPTMGSEEEEELEQDFEDEHELELDHELKDCALSPEAFPPLSPSMVPQAPTTTTDAMEPNFLMDIELEPFSRPEKKLISFGSLRLKPVVNADLRTMLDELDVMRLELDAAMARCTSILDDDEKKMSASNSRDLEPEEEPIFCC